MKSGHDGVPRPQVASDGEEALVLDYLERNPDFLIRHPEILIKATAPNRYQESDSKVVDFQHAMLQRLQTEMTDLQNCAEELILTTRSNMDNQKGTFDAALILLEAEGQEDLAQIISESLPLLLDVDFCAMRLETQASGISTKTACLPQGFIESCFGQDIDTILRPLAEGEAMLYGESAPLVRSDALVRLEPGEGLAPGLLALGSRIESAFSPEMSVDLLTFVARIIEHCLRRWMQKAA